MLFVYENTPAVDKHCAQANLVTNLHLKIKKSKKRKPVENQLVLLSGT